MRNIVKLWEEFKTSFPNLEKFIKSHPRTNRAFENLENEMTKAFHDYESWKQIFDALDVERKLSVDEIKILKEMRAILTAEQGVELVAKVVAIVVEENQDDPVRLKRITAKLGKLIGDRTAVSSETGNLPTINIDTSGMDRGQVSQSRSNVVE